jgi:hypothetical protein
LNGLQPTAVVEARAQRDILLSNTLKVIKLTFVASAVGVPNQLYQARQAQNSCNPTPIVVAAIIAAVAVGPIVESAGKPGAGGKKMKTLRAG